MRRESYWKTAGVVLACTSLAVYTVTALGVFADATSTGIGAARRGVSWGALGLSLSLLAMASLISFHQRKDPGVGVPLFLAGIAGSFILVASSAAAG